MKRMFVLVMAISVLISTVVYAGDLEVQVIGGPEMAVATQDFDDIQVGQSYKIDGYATVKPQLFEFFDCFAQYAKDFAGNNDHKDNSSLGNTVVYWDNGSWYHANAFWNDSGTSADFAWLMVDVVNLQKKDVNFMEEMSIKVVYDEDYEFSGWVRQMNYDYETTIFRKNYEGSYYISRTEDKYQYSHYAIDPENEEPIGQMYTGHYICGCTLPTEVIEDKVAPLKMIITIGGNELTYNIRK